MNPQVSKSKLPPPPSLSESSSSSRSNHSTISNETGDTSLSSKRFLLQDMKFQFPSTPISKSSSHHPLAILSGHIGSVSCFSLRGEFILSASQSKDIIARKHPHFRIFTKFGQGDGSVKSLVMVGNKVFSGDWWVPS